MPRGHGLLVKSDSGLFSDFIFQQNVFGIFAMLGAEVGNEEGAIELVRVDGIQVVEAQLFFEDVRVLGEVIRLEIRRPISLKVDQVVALGDVVEVEARHLLVLVVEVRARHFCRVFDATC